MAKKKASSKKKKSAKKRDLAQQAEPQDAAAEWEFLNERFSTSDVDFNALAQQLPKSH